jgi:hypothetical protein
VAKTTAVKVLIEDTPVPKRLLHDGDRARRYQHRPNHEISFLPISPLDPQSRGSTATGALRQIKQAPDAEKRAFDQVWPIAVVHLTERPWDARLVRMASGAALTLQPCGM